MATQKLTGNLYLICGMLRVTKGSIRTSQVWFYEHTSIWAPSGPVCNPRCKRWPGFTQLLSDMEKADKFDPANKKGRKKILAHHRMRKWYKDVFMRLKLDSQIIMRITPIAKEAHLTDVQRAT